MIVRVVVILCSFFLVLLGCDSDNWPDIPVTPSPTPVPTSTPIAPPTMNPTPVPTLTAMPGLFIPDNCNNPPRQISSTSGFKCKGSETRGGAIVCLLPWEFTWEPYVVESDGHLSSSRKFNSVYLVRHNGSFIDLDWSGYANPVYLPQGKVNRQHWRNSSAKWDSVKSDIVRIEMIRDSKRTCLRL